MEAFFSTSLPRGTSTVACMPVARAANPMLWPWFPRVAVMTLVIQGCSSFRRVM
jgi:hypothetical protein